MPPLEPWPLLERDPFELDDFEPELFGLAAFFAAFGLDCDFGFDAFGFDLDFAEELAPFAAEPFFAFVDFVLV